MLLSLFSFPDRHPVNDFDTYFPADWIYWNTSMSSNLTSSSPDDPHILGPRWALPSPWPPLYLFPLTDLPILPLPLHLAGSLARNHRHIWHTYFFYKFCLSLLYSNQVFEFSVYRVTLFAPSVSLICFSPHLAYLVMLNILNHQVNILLFLLIYLKKKEYNNLIIHRQE